MAETLLSGAVGAWAQNKTDDVLLVQRMLNAVPQSSGGPMPVLVADGISGPKTIGAISRYQRVAIGFADGRIDPAGKTEAALTAVLQALGLLAKLLGDKGAPPPPGPPGPVTPPTTPPLAIPPAGPGSPIRRRFMAICKELLPPKGQLTNGTGPPGFTSCGEFPSRVWIRVLTLRSWQKGAFKVRLDNGLVLNLHSFQTQWEQFAQAVDRDYPPARTWIPFAGGRPLPGDIYVLHQFSDPTKFQHVGVIVSAEGSTWTTADGGQGNGHQSGFIERKFHADGQIDGEFGNKARLRGWVDLDALWTVIVASTPHKLLTA